MARKRFSGSARALALIVIPLVTKIVLPMAIESLRRRKFDAGDVLDEARDTLDKNLKKTRSELEDVKQEAVARGVKLYEEARNQGTEFLETLARKGVEVASEWVESLEKPRRRKGFPFGRVLAVVAIVGVGIALVGRR